MHQKRKKIVATCMIVYMGTLALPQTPAHAQENETAVKEPAGEHASTNTAMPEMIGTAATVHNDTQDETVLDGEGEAAAGPDEEAAENETAEETKDAVNTEVTEVTEETEGQEHPADVSGDGETADDDADEQKEPSSDTHETIIEKKTTGALATALAQQAEDNHVVNLDITVTDSIKVQTPTMTGVYDEGAAGGYEPGKDYSSTDDISTGKSVLYDLSFLFGDRNAVEGNDSEATKNYILSNVQIVSVDKDGNELSNAQTPIYWNQGVSTEQRAVIKDPKWVEGADFVTGGTARMTLAVELPQAVYWDTQIAPRIKIRATVQGNTVDSEIIELPAVKLSSQALMNHHFVDGASQKIIYDKEKKAFNASFKFYTGLEAKTNIIGLLDQPQYWTQTYYFNVEAKIDKSNVESLLKSENFRVEPGSGMELADKDAVSYDAESKVLAVTMQPAGEAAPQKCDTAIYVEVPHEWAGIEPHGLEHEVSVKLTMPKETGVDFEGFANEMLFEQNIGSNWTTSGSLECPDKAQAAEGAPWFTESIAATDAELGTFSHEVSFSNMGLDTDGYITIYEVLPHRMAYLTENGVVHEKIDGQGASAVANVEILYGWSGQLMAIGQAGKGTQTDYSVLQQDLQNGKILLANPDSVVAETEHCPNIKAYRFKAPALEEGQKVTYTIEGASYARLPENQINRQAIWHEGRMISLVSLPVQNDEKILAALRAGLNKSMDTIQTAADGKTYLNLGASKYNDERIQRFQEMSVPRSSAQMKSYYDELVLSIVDQDGKVCRTISDYGQSYGLQLLKTTKYVSGNTFLQSGATITCMLPEELVPYISMDTPYIVSNGHKTDVTDYVFDRENHTLTVTLPADLLLTQKGQDGLYMTLQFARPIETIQLSKGDLQVKAEGNVCLKLANEKKIMHDYTRSINGVLGEEKDNYFELRYTKHDPLTLLAAEKDNQELRLNGSGQYANGDSVTFKGLVFNTTGLTNDYYAAFSVPTERYNMATNGEDSVEQGSIKAIRADNADAVIYYQTASGASDGDLQMMWYSYRQSDAYNLMNYYSSTIKANWQPYQAGERLPDDVIMFVVYQPELASEQSLEVEYDVQMAVGEEDEASYTNAAVMKYYSGGTTMEVWSNRVVINNIPADPGKEKPVDPNKPVEPGVPVDPNKPVEPEIPVDPDKPTNPEIPVDPDQPTNPVNPGNPNNPGSIDGPEITPDSGDNGGDVDIEPVPVPQAPLPENPPEVTIEDALIPLAAEQPELAAATEDTVWIEEGDVPLAQQPGDNPHTGQEKSSLWSGILAALAGLGLGTTWLEGRRKKENQ